jgi:tRNA (cytidine/uridine-2'-O-)-methyltransferase
VLRSPLFHITLHEPEIPNNTGNIGRTCVAAGSRLHLIHPLGFDTSEKACRRAGLDYWPRLGVREHTDWDAYLDAMAREQGHPPRLWLFSAYATRPMFDANFRRGDHLVFGKETAGLPPALLEQHADRLLLLPMVPGERGLNVATVVCAAVYEAMRQLLSRGEVSLGPDSRLREP